MNNKTTKNLLTPEQYIESLKETRQKVYKIHDAIDDAIELMQRRLETGYTHLEDHSKTTLKNAIGHTEVITDELKKLYNNKINY